MLISDLLGTDDGHQFFSDSLVGKEEKCQISIWTAILLSRIRGQKEYLGCWNGSSVGEYSSPVDFCSIWARRWIKCSLRMKHRHVHQLRYSCGLILESPIPRRYCHSHLQAVPWPRTHTSLSWCVKRKSVDRSSSAQHLSLLYCLLSKLELAVLQLSS